MATEAYSVIEQGKVDVLLQSSPRERRLIFEEAAGISRFKAKKIEALRRLERVEQNLLRLSDIVDEVESRLRAVRLQAGKARRYKEYSDRLQALRTQIGLADWRKLSARLSESDAEVTAIQSEIAVQLAQADSHEAQAVALDGQIVAADAATRASEGRIAQNRERIAAHESAIEHQRRTCLDLEEEIARCRRQLTSMGLRAGDVVQQLRDIVANLSAAELQHREVARRLAEEERGLTKLTAQIDELRTEAEQWRAAHLDQLRGIAALESQIVSLESKVATTRMAQERGAKRLAELIASRDALAAELERLRMSTDALAAECQGRQSQLEQAQSQLAASRRDASLARDRLGQLRQKHSGASERAAVLEELEKRLEGLSAGVKQVLTQAQGSKQGPFGQIRGLVADLLHVNFETAPLVEIALGEMAQCLVVAGGRDWANQLHEAESLAGRVGFIRLDTPATKTHLDALDLHGHEGVLGRADEFVETAPEFAVLAKRLLGKTWIVESLPHALALSESIGRGLSFVTRAGEMVAADATLYLGPRHTSTGLISRRSELRILRQQIAEMAAEIERHATLCAEFEQQIVAQERQVQSLAAEARQLHERHQQERMRRTTGEERQSQLCDLCESLAAELAATTTEHDRAASVLAESKTRLTKVAGSQRELEARMSEGAQRAKDLEQVRQRTGREAAATKIDVVKSEQWLSHLKAQQSQLERDQQERGRTLADSRSQLATSTGRLRQAEREILAAESEVAELYLRKEQVAAEAVRHVSQRDMWRENKVQLDAESQRARARIRKLEARLHARQLTASEVRLERTALVDRLREDYGIELAELEQEPSAEELQERTAAESEIADLRAKLNSIGGVNLDALAELDELEVRYNTLSAQHGDLSSAKTSLESIIGKINADSRRLFAETLEVVRGHFQALFRKLFGGGQADIVLDEGVDILDSGIEIVARPPGKEPRNISLLSGGEKTLTCVAMLLAIFRSRPSPFCVLDEVDAALDEANIERFIGVLQEFLAWTQFIVVTHSKKTMTCASTLYGVTMEESGVSKRVSVRFEDVSEDGEILNVRDSDAPPESGDETQAA